MSLSKSKLEKKYNVTLIQTIGTDDKRLFWQAFNDDYSIFVDGWTLSEINTKLAKK